MEFRILGPLEVRSDRGEVAVTGGKPAAVLAVLLLNANESVSFDTLAMALWGEDVPGGAHKTLQVHVSRLRKALPGGQRILETVGGGYRLKVGPGELDAERFRTLTEEAREALRSGEPARASELLRQALTLWRGPPLANFTSEPFAPAEIARLEEEKLAALEARLEADLAAGRHHAVAGELQQLVAEHPTREQLVGHLMLALYRCGRQPEALEAYQQAHRVLVDIGLAPRQGLRELEQAILRQDPALDPPAVLKLPAALDAVASSPLVGRHAELAVLRERWESARSGRRTVVELVGGPGSGKTRLAAELAGEVHRRGATVLAVDGTGPRELIDEAIARAGEARRPTLLVLDDASEAGADFHDRLRAIHGPVLALVTGTHATSPDGETLVLPPLDRAAVREIALAYAGAKGDASIPDQWLLDASAGAPGRVHELASHWARRINAGVGRAEPMVLATRRTATVLAAVFEGRGASGRADPEPVRRLAKIMSGEARQIVERHGGTLVSEREPETVFAVFGAPKGREEDVLRALRAADDLRTAAHGLSDGEPVTLEIRIGVATGLVIVETTPGQPSIVGDPMTVSAELARHAERGDIVLSDATYQQAREAIRAERLADESGWRLRGLIAGAASVPRDLTVPLVDRDRELALARNAFVQATRAREAQMLTVIGDAGMGKSRLAAALEAQLADMATILTGHSLSYGEGVAFWPLREAIAQAAGSESRDAVRTLVGEIADADLVADIVAGAVGLTTGEGAAEQLPWAFRRLLEALAKRRPLVLVIEDAHWAEPPLLELLDHLIDWLRTAPVLLVCLARPELLQRRPELAGGRPRVTSVVLEPLGEADAQGLLEHHQKSRPLSAADRRRILATAEGNPLFVEQLLAMRNEDPSWDAGPAVPATVQALLAARLDRLTDGERACLGCAAVVGREFWLDAVLDMLAPDLARESAGNEIAELVHRGLIRPHASTVAGEQGMRFHHVLIRDVAYEAISLERRSELHERLATWLEGREGFEEFIGHHLERAFEYRRALRRLEDDDLSLAARAAERLADAGRRVLARGDTVAAVALLRRSAALLEVSGRQRPRVLLDLGATLTESGEFEDAERILNRALAQAEAVADDPLIAHILIEDSYRRLLVGSGEALTETLAVAERAIETFQGPPEDHDGLSHAYMHKAHVQWTRCQGAEMEAALEAALQHAEHGGGGHDRARMLGGLARAAMMGPRPVDDGIGRCHAILARCPGDVTLVVVTEAMLAVLESMRGRFDDARDHWSTAVRRLEEVDLGVTLAPLRMYRGFIELMAGTPKRAEPELIEAYDLLSRIGERHRLLTLAAVLARVLYAQGRFDECERYTSVSAGAPEDDIVSHIIWRGVHANVLARRGERRTAEDLADAAVALAERTDFLYLHGDALLDRAGVRAAHGRGADAIADLDAAIRLYERKGATVSAEAARRLRESLPGTGQT